jgi:hypothetical protein
MDEEVRLGPAESVPERPFSDVERNHVDLEAMRLMLTRLREVLEAGEDEERSPPRIVRLTEAGRSHRIVILNPEGLRGEVDLTAVGFFGQSRPDLDRATFEELQTVDWELVGEFSQHPGVLSYSTLELEDGNAADLALLSDPGASQHWMTSTRHAYAANELSPRCYSSVRLHSGLLPGGVRSGRDPVLLQTKYLDFRAEKPWRALRLLSA